MNTPCKSAITLSLLALLASGCGSEPDASAGDVVLISPTSAATLPESAPPELSPEPAPPPVEVVTAPDEPAQATNLEGTYFERFQRLADAGNTHAVFETGLMLYHGVGGAEKNRDEGRARLEEAARSGLPLAMSRLGDILLGEGDRESALDWYKRAAEAGDPDGPRNAAYVLAYESEGELTESPERLEAAKEYLSDAIERGDQFSMAMLGGILMDEGKPKEAEAVLRAPAAAGVAMAMDRYLALVRFEGDGVELDKALVEKIRESEAI